MIFLSYRLLNVAISLSLVMADAFRLPGRHESELISVNIYVPMGSFFSGGMFSIDSKGI